MRRQLLPLLWLLGAARSQSIISRGFQRFGPPDRAIPHSIAWNGQVDYLSECAARALDSNAWGFNFKVAPESSGKHQCQVSNHYPWCSDRDWENRPGWEYYFGGRAGQNEVPPYRDRGHTITTSVDPNAYAPVLSGSNPSYRWGADCNAPTNDVHRDCSRYVLTGIYNNAGRMDDLDYARCFQYGNEFGVSQEIGAVVPVAFDPVGGDPRRHQCPPQQVVTAIADTDDHAFSHADLVKCNLLLGNWRVNYDDCRLKDPQNSGGGSTGGTSNWHIGEPNDQVWGVVAMWRQGRIWTGFKSCRLYRLA